MCAAYTKIETCHIQAHEVCRIHAYTIQHTYCIYICYLHAHICMYTAYILYISATILGMYLHTCSIYTAYILHIYLLPYKACIQHTYCIRAHLHMYAAHVLHTIHPYCCIHKNWLSATRIPYKHNMKKCMQFVCNCLHAACNINNCMYAAHDNCTRVAYMYSDACDLMCMYVACVWR